MSVEIEVPTQFQGSVTGDLASRRGLVSATEIKANVVIITADVPLANMFGYSTDLRSMTQGQATFSMEFARYLPVSVDVRKALREKYDSQMPEEDD